MSGVGSPIDVLTDVFRTTPPGFASGPEVYVNEASLAGYITTRMQTGRELAQMLDGGESIRDDIIFDVESSRQVYNPNEPLNYKLINTITQHQAPWCFVAYSISYTEHELGLNFGQLRSSAQKKVFKKIYKAKMTNLWTDISNGEEAAAWAQPVVQMEQSGSRTLQSLVHFANEFPLGLAPGITTVQQLAPAAFAKWAPVQGTYVGGLSGTLAEKQALAANVFGAMTRQYRLMSFDRMPYGPEYSDPKTRPDFIAASLRGVQLYEDSLRVSNELLLGNRQDPAFPDPMFRGMPVHYFPQLDNALIHSLGGTAFGSEATATVTGPRFFFVNTRYGKRVWKDDRYFEQRFVDMGAVGQPFTTVMVVDSWGNYFCHSRRKFMGIVSPSTSVTSYSFAIA